MVVYAIALNRKREPDITRTVQEWQSPERVDAPRASVQLVRATHPGYHRRFDYATPSDQLEEV